VFGEAGLVGIFLVVLATGLGLLLDFQLTHLHPVFSIGMILISIPASQYWTLRRVLLMERKPSPSEYTRNMALAVVAGQSGCGTVVLIVLALFGGMYLDARLDTHPVFTIGLVLVSVPLSLYAMVRMVLSATSMIRTPPPAGPTPTSRARSGIGKSLSGVSDQPSTPTKENGP
jgi:hypothetical protein